MNKWNIAIIVLCCFFSTLNTYASLNQNCTTYDSLLLLVNKTNDKQQIDVLIELARVVNDTAPENSFAFAFKALNLSTASGYLKGKADARLIIGNYLLTKRKYVPALQFFLGALPVYQDMNDKKGELEALRCVGFL
jgi:hypothetical protein